MAKKSEPPHVGCYSSGAQGAKHTFGELAPHRMERGRYSGCASSIGKSVLPITRECNQRAGSEIGAPRARLASSCERSVVTAKDETLPL
jgi:hypothetical protein